MARFGSNKLINAFSSVPSGGAILVSELAFEIQTSWAVEVQMVRNLSINYNILKLWLHSDNVMN